MDSTNPWYLEFWNQRNVVSSFLKENLSPSLGDIGSLFVITLFTGGGLFLYNIVTTTMNDYKKQISDLKGDLDHQRFVSSHHEQVIHDAFHDLLKINQVEYEKYLMVLSHLIDVPGLSGRFKETLRLIRTNLSGSLNLNQNLFTKFQSLG